VVGTIHSVKGGEAEDVVVIPDLSRAAAMERWNGDVGRDAITRTMYVALTRASERLFLASPASTQYVDLPPGD
jgi:superfamily I DNA/RNA helicase